MNFRSFSTALAMCTALCFPVAGALAADILFENVTLIDGTGTAPVTGASVLVKGDRIDLVSPVPLKHEPGVEVVDGRGKFLMPGLIDSHIHVGANVITVDKFKEQHEIGVRALHSFLYLGVTSVYDSGNVPDYIFGLRAEEQSGKLVSPRLFASGTTVNVAGGRGGGPIRPEGPQTPNSPIRLKDSWSESRPMVDAYFKTRKPDVQKMVIDRRGVFEPPTPIMTVEQMTNVVRLANENGIRTTIHAASEEDYNDALAAHVDQFAHVIRYPASDALLKLLATKRIPLATTTSVFAYIERLADTPQFLDEPAWKASVDPDVIKHLKTEERDGFIKSGQAKNFKAMRHHIVQNSKKVHDLGGVLVAGTDRGWGTTLHMELDILHREGGIPLLDLTRIVTLNGAIYLNKEKDLGSIQRGKLADILLLNADPTKDVKNFAAIAAVYKGGEKIDFAKLDIPINKK